MTLTAELFVSVGSCNLDSQVDHGHSSFFGLSLPTTLLMQVVATTDDCFWLNNRLREAVGCWGVCQVPKTLLQRLPWRWVGLSGSGAKEASFELGSGCLFQASRSESLRKGNQLSRPRLVTQGSQLDLFHLVSTGHELGDGPDMLLRSHGGVPS